MSDSEHDRREAAIAVDLANRFRDWWTRAGLTDGEQLSDVAVGFADMITAARAAREALEFMLTRDPTSEAGADDALSVLGYLHALYFTEMQTHMSDLEHHWDSMMELVASRLPDDEHDA